MTAVRVAVIGVGNCASSLVQGVAHYRETGSTQGLIHDEICGYRASDVEFVMAVDVDPRKVGKDLSEAIFASPNNTQVFKPDMPTSGVTVMMGRVLDGVAEHMTTAGDRGFAISDAAEATQRERNGASRNRKTRARLDDDRDQAIASDARFARQYEGPAIAARERQDHPACLEPPSIQLDVEMLDAFRKRLDDRIAVSCAAQHALGAIVQPRDDAGVESGADHQEERRAVDRAATDVNLRSFEQDTRNVCGATRKLDLVR